jgi:hypothetical protein
LIGHSSPGTGFALHLADLSGAGTHDVPAGARLTLTGAR